MTDREWRTAFASALGMPPAAAALGAELTAWPVGVGWACAGARWTATELRAGWAG
jgi:hypothetical protein